MAITAQQYITRRTNIITSIHNDYETLVTWGHKEFVPLDKLTSIDRSVVVLSGFSSVRDMLEDVRKTIERKKKGLIRIERKIDKILNNKIWQE